MPAWVLRREAAALLGYVCVALAFTWPLAMHVSDALLAPPGGDTGVYIWNLWVFRHEIVQNHHLPFLTSEILALSAPVPLALHNYTTFANIIAFPLLPILGVVTTFNTLIVASGVMTAYAMYAYARARTGDAGAAWLGGLLFGFSPFMSARVADHFSLALAAPLPLFAWLLYRIKVKPTLPLICAAGATVAWAFLCDAYYAVYCLLMAGFMAVCTAVNFERRPVDARRQWWPAVLDLAMLCVVGLIVGITLRGGGRLDVFGIRISVMRLYNPVLVLTVLAFLRVWLIVKPRVEWSRLSLGLRPRGAFVGALVCAVILSPVLSAAGLLFDERQWISPHIWWRSSPAGVDLFAFFVPNPLHVLFGQIDFDWLDSMSGGFRENVASIPLVAIATIAAAMLLVRFRPPRPWLIFTAFFALLALGPFVRIAGYNTHVPTPWALLRYLPVVGAARMPSRLTVLVMLGVAMILTMALQHLRTRVKRPDLLLATVGALLVFELAPAPRTLYSAGVPLAYEIIATDPRPVRVLTLPFGLRDGTRSRGNFSAATQYYQTVHGKRLVGGYLSRLPQRAIDRYRRDPVLRTLLRLGEGTPVEPMLFDAAYEGADRTLDRLNIGYVVIHRDRAPDALIAFARQAFPLELVSSDGAVDLYRTR
jgi:hypothetical protein